MRVRVKNVQQGFIDATGFHPIRASADYSPKVAGEQTTRKRAKPRKRAAVKKRAPAKKRAVAKKRAPAKKRAAGRKRTTTAKKKTKRRGNPMYQKRFIFGAGPAYEVMDKMRAAGISDVNFGEEWEGSAKVYYVYSRDPRARMFLGSSRRR